MSQVKAGQFVSRYLSDYFGAADRSMCEEAKYLIQVHSIYENGFNFLLGEQLLFVGNQTKGISPFGIHFEQAVFDELKAYVSLDYKLYLRQLSPTSYEFEIRRSCFSFHIKNPYQGKLSAFNFFSKKNRAYCLELIASRSLNLGWNFEQELSGESTSLAALFSRDKVKQKEGLCFYLGRGKGLTPSGDDFLVGLMAVDQVENMLSADFYRQLRELLAERKWTTEISTLYLMAAVEGFFSSLIYNVFQAFENRRKEEIEAALEALQDCGNTSGSDLLAGIYIGLKHCGKELVNE